MGKPMAGHLLKAGHKFTVPNPRRGAGSPAGGLNWL